MKKLVGLATAAMCVGMLSPATAQVMIQPQLGVTFAKVSDLDETGVSTKTRTGFVGGVGILFALNERISIGTGGYYAQQGVKLSDETGEATVKLDYIQVPLTLSLGFPTGGSVTPHLFAGPMLGFKASCKISAEAAGASASVDCDAADIPVKSTDFGILFGGGVGIRAGTGMFVLNGWYDLGLTNIDDSPSAGASTSKPKNRMFGFSVGYAFPLGGGM